MVASAAEQGVRGMRTIIRADGREIHLDDISSAAQAERIFSELVDSIIQIEGQLEAHSSGERPRTPDWLRRVNIALKRKRFQRPLLQQRIAELRKAGRAAEQAADSDFVGAAKNAKRKAFVNAAKEILQPEQFAQIWRRAQEMRPAAFSEAQS